MDDDAQNQQTDEEGFDGYVENTVDPGPWLLLGTTLFCFGVMLIIVPLMVAFKLRQRSRQAEHDINKEEQLIMEEQTKETVDTGAWSILSFNKETRKILKLAIPYTVSALASSTFSNICLVMVSQYIGTKAVAAYALVQILVGLTDGMLYGPIYSCTTLCAHAVGAGNTELAGQYIQLAMFFYLLFNIPIVYLWWFYMYEVILFLEWGDEATAEMAQDFIRVYIWSYILGGISSSVWQLLEVADHAVEGTVISILWGATNAALISALVTTREANLQEVGFLYILTAVMFIGLTFALAYCRGWLRPFTKGLFGTFALKNGSAIAMLLKQAVPLSFGSLLSNAEWAVLTFFASNLGPAEVAAWAILGSIWDVFYSVTSGIGDAAEIRVAYHLGDNHPTMAKLSAYKSLLLGMLVATVISIIYFSLQDRIPVWFTSDETLQSMLAELVPFVGVANLTMTFGMQCWSLIGAQGKYKLATWISFVSSWGICMPLSALYVFVFRIDLQGLTSAVVLGYVTTGAVLSFTLLSTDWYKVARKIQDQNSDTATGKDKSEEDGEEELYASLKYNSQAAKAAARRNIRLVTVPAGCKSGIILGNFYSRPGTYVLMVQHWSPLYGRVKPGDSILAIDGVNVSQESAIDISARLKTALFLDRQLAVTTPPGEMEDEYQDLLLQTVAEDESSEAPPTNSFSAQVF